MGSDEWDAAPEGPHPSLRTTDLYLSDALWKRNITLR
jgi:hypothetical protein